MGNDNTVSFWLLVISMKSKMSEAKYEYLSAFAFHLLQFQLIMYNVRVVSLVWRIEI